MNAQFHPIVERIANGVNIPVARVDSVLNLSSDGGTVAFIARYRKEQTGGLDEVAIRSVLSERDRILDILDRQQTIIKSVEEQKKLTPELRTRILSTFSRTELEDIYAPYKKKKKTKADIARDLGIEPFAETILKQRIEEGDCLRFARSYLDPVKKLTQPEAVVEHAVNIIVEMIAHDVDLKKSVRAHTFNTGSVFSKKAPRFSEDHSKFETYYNYREKIKNLVLPKNSHRILAIRRGFAEKVLSIGVEAEPKSCIDIIAGSYLKNPKSIFYPLVERAVATAYNDYMQSSIELDIFNELKEIADGEAVHVFSMNVKDLLLSSPLGEKVVTGVDPGFRTGCKIVVTDRNGKLLDYATIYQNEPHNKAEEAESLLLEFWRKHSVEAVAIGNGTASRETEKFINGVIEKNSLKDRIISVVVSEAGASIYSASDVAREEFPDLDITYRGAVSIARRLQDPLAELVKIEPRSIGVGQYQHDVDQKLIKEKLEAVVEDCVNYVGVDLNTASTQLLSYVSGIGKSLAASIVQFRNENSSFAERAQLMNVPKLGEKCFEQAAGFLRIRNGVNRLDNTAVHPERYELISTICSASGKNIEEVIGNDELINGIFGSPESVNILGEFTVKDVMEELKKPGRDPRTEFKKISFNDNLATIDDVKTGMIVNGVVSNITNFGVFVDIGIHEDGLIHISELTGHGFVKDPRDVVSLGAEIKARVIAVDIGKKQISLSVKQLVPPASVERPKKRFDKGQEKGRQAGSGDKKPAHKKPMHKKENRSPRIDPNSPFASLASIRDKVKKSVD
ncbi:MAG: RNA-binding transcriptional accessory protein [Oligoflexia bacterium]|nr:RNA-binding transcriptional accessory protein [Oligoflexia bacterium]